MMHDALVDRVALGASGVDVGSISPMLRTIRARIVASDAPELLGTSSTSVGTKTT